jgi:uncharacterized membrane protein YfhO
MEPIGWNPTKKLAPRITKKKKFDPNNALVKHKRFLKQLEEQRMKEKENKEKEEAENMEKTNKFKENAEKQRKKIKDLKQTGGLEDEDSPQREEAV